MKQPLFSGKWFGRRKAQEPPTKPGNTRKYFPRKIFPVAVAASIAFGAIGTHFALRTAYGRSYAKRIPLAGKPFAQGKQLDFFLYTQHSKTNDMASLERVVNNAKEQGKPYNVLVLEEANSMVWNRRALETKYRGLALNGNGISAVHRELFSLARKNNLLIKVGEEYSARKQAELRSLEKTLESAWRHRDLGRAVQIYATYLRKRNQSMGATINQVLLESKKELGGKEPVCLFVVGKLHGGIDGGGAVKMADRNVFAPVRHFVGDTKTFDGSNFSPEQQRFMDLFHQEALKLAEKNPNTINTYVLPPIVQKEAQELYKTIPEKWFNP